MVQNWVVAAALAAIGWCIWVRRHSWRVGADQALSLAVLFQGIGFALCVPIQGRYLGRVLLELTGIGHMRDYFGHLFFLSAAAAVVYAVSLRLFPDYQLRSFMLRIELPGALGAALMLVAITNSAALHHACPPDFFDVRGGGWLVLYWVTYCAFKGYILIYAIGLLLVLRTDPRSRRTAGLLIAATAINLVDIGGILAAAFIPSLEIPNYVIWAGFSLSASIAAYAAGLSWRERTRFRDDDGGHERIHQPPEPVS